jgi:hypothetical protein
MRHRPIVALLVAFPALLGAAGAWAQTQEDLARLVKSGVCPDDLSPYEVVKYADHCAGMDERSCDLNDKACFDAAGACWAQVNSMNKQIYSYNNFMKKCAAAQKAQEKPGEKPADKADQKPAQK